MIKKNEEDNNASLLKELEILDKIISSEKLLNDQQYNLNRSIENNQLLNSEFKVLFLRHTDFYAFVK